MRRAPIALLVVLAVTVAGCGGDGSSAENAAPTAPATTATTVPDDRSRAASADDCRELAKVAANLVNALTGQPAKDLEGTRDFLLEFAERTPEEIRADFRVVADAYANYVDALSDLFAKGGQPDDPEVLRRLQEVARSLDQDRLQRANANISRWVQQSCR